MYSTFKKLKKCKSADALWQIPNSFQLYLPEIDTLTSLRKDLSEGCTWLALGGKVAKERLRAVLPYGLCNR